MRKVIEFIKYIVLLFLLLLFSCHDKSSNNTLYNKLPNEKYDATCTYLNTDKNYSKSEYFSTFYNYYNLKIQQKKYVEAENALKIVTNKGILYLSFNDLLLKTTNEFLLLYKNKIPEINVGFAYNYIANYYIDKGENRKGIVYLNKITVLEPKNREDYDILGQAYYDLSYTHNSLGNQEIALKYSYKALECFEKINDDVGKAMVYDNLGNIYVYTKRFQEAEKNYNNAIKLYKKEKSWDNLFLTLHSKLTLFEANNDERFSVLADSTYHAFLKSKSTNNSIKSILTSFYVKKMVNEKKYDIAKKCLDNVKSIAVDNDSKSLLEDYSCALVYYEINANKGISDIETYKKAIPILIENENYPNLSTVYNLFKEDALRKKNYKAAFEYAIEEQKAVDKLANQEMKEKVIEVETKYKTNQKEKLLTLKQLQIKKKQNIITLLISSLIILVLGILGYSLLQSRKKLKQQQEIKNMFTKQLLENNEEQRKRIANDLHDGISHELLNLKTTTTDGFLNLNVKIDNIIDEIRQISRNLHPAMFDRVGLVFSVKQLVENIELKNQFMITTDLNYTNKLSPENELQLYRIIQESLNNIIKYAQSHAAKITINETEENIFLEIKDNGKGFNVEEKLNGKTAFGLHSIIERSIVIGGTATIKSSSNGTIVSVKIPLK